MPDIQDQTFPYELLVRYGPDGAPVGAHVQYLRRITLDGEVIKDDILPAQPIDLAGFPTSGIMADTCRDALATVATQAAQIAALNGQLETANANLATVSDDADKLRTELTNVQAEAVTNQNTLNGQLITLSDQLALANQTIEQQAETIKQLQAALAAAQPAG